jgi:hypothetical protein
MASKFSKFDRVRIKFGADRGCYGTVVHIGGDDGTYYGVSLDIQPGKPVGYSEYELDSEIPGQVPLWNGSQYPVPKHVATCPECLGELVARSMEWETETGRPVASSIEIDCLGEIRQRHDWKQHLWQPVRDAIAKWADART